MAEQYLYRDKVVFSHTSDYQHIVVTESKAGDVSCYINGQLQFNSFDEYIYHEQLVHPAFVLAPVRKRVLVLGGGDGLAVREILKYSEVESITLCDLDPVMTELARNNEYFAEMNRNSLQDARLVVIDNHALVPSGTEPILVRSQKNPYNAPAGTVAEVAIINIDAARFVEQISGVYDVIIIDFPDPNTPELAKLYSKKFYTQIARKLAAYGIMVQQATSPVQAKEAFLCIGRTMEASGLAAVPYHDNVPSFGEWGWWIAGRKERYAAEDLQTKL
ncbi:MAG: spermidine synthase, partial [bacterium]|nr:spermidine synthase [bacterium]